MSYEGYPPDLNVCPMAEWQGIRNKVLSNSQAVEAFRDHGYDAVRIGAVLMVPYIGLAGVIDWHYPRNLIRIVESMSGGTTESNTVARVP